jgi:hypothetical protein
MEMVRIGDMEVQPSQAAMYLGITLDVVLR